MEERTISDETGPPSRAAATEPYPAATIVLLREMEGSREVLLLRRPLQSVFASDCWVFPGGRIDPADRVLDHERFADGPCAAEWARILCLDDAVEAAAYVVAAVREAWEETGILLAMGEGSPAACDAARLDLLAGRRSLNDFLDEAHLKIATNRLRYIAHWITPDWLPRRFDTRFFMSIVEPESRCNLTGGELTDSAWMTPALALAAADAGEMQLLPPTLDTLRRIHDREL